MTLTAPSDTSSTTYTGVAKLSGAILGAEKPDGASLYANMFAFPDTVSVGETVHIRPRITRVEQSGGFTTATLDELEIVFDSGESAGSALSGWTEITSIDAENNEIIAGNSLEAKVSGGTATFRDRSVYAVGFSWRVD